MKFSLLHLPTYYPELHGSAAMGVTNIRAHLKNTQGSVARPKFGRKARGAGNSGDYCQATQHRARTFGAQPAGLGPVSRPIYQLGALLVVAIRTPRSPPRALNCTKLDPSTAPSIFEMSSSLLVNFGGLASDKTLTSMARFAQHVMPRFQ